MTFVDVCSRSLFTIRTQGSLWLRTPKMIGGPFEPETVSTVEGSSLQSGPRSYCYDHNRFIVPQQPSDLR
jgi:hypothetical protein